MCGQSPPLETFECLANKERPALLCHQKCASLYNIAVICFCRIVTYVRARYRSIYNMYMVCERAHLCVRFDKADARMCHRCRPHWPGIDTIELVKMFACHLFTIMWSTPRLMRVLSPHVCTFFFVVFVFLLALHHYRRLCNSSFCRCWRSTRSQAPRVSSKRFSHFFFVFVVVAVLERYGECVCV